MKKFILMIAVTAFMLTSIFGCGADTDNVPATDDSATKTESLLDPKNPTVINMWHVYGEQADAPMNVLINEFNSTVGLEKGVKVNVTNVTSTSKILAQLNDSIAGNPGSLELPDMFSCHTQNAATLGADRFVDFSSYFTDEELSLYVPEFIESGMLDGKLCVFPVSKSTYALFISGSQFDRFSAETGVTYGDLSTWVGFFDAAEKYYEWSDGTPFCAFDYLIRHVELDVLSKTGTLEYTENGWYDETDPDVEASFEMFARSIAMGHIVISETYANNRVMGGKAMCGIGSSAAVGYYNDVVSYPDNTTEPMELHVLALPKSGGSEEFMPQTGVGLAAFKTTDAKAEAAAVFVKWFTESERNLDFVVETGYMPVTDGAFEAIDGYSFEDEGYRSLYSAIDTMYNSCTAVVRPDFDGFYEKTDALYNKIKQIQPSLVERYANGEELNTLVNELWELFCSIA